MPTDAESLRDRLKRGDYDSAVLEVVFGVSQPTVSRLRRGLIGRVSRYSAALDRFEAEPRLDVELDGCMVALRRRADEDPSARDLLIALASLMQNA